MAAIDEIRVSATPTKEAIAAVLWQWLYAHRDEVVYTVHFWFITKSFTYGDLFPVFETLLGSRGSK